MTKQELVDYLQPHLLKNPEGIFINGEFDLDVNLDDRECLALWLDGNTKVSVPNDPELVQRVVQSLGRKLLHTWGLQYNEVP